MTTGLVVVGIALLVFYILFLPAIFDTATEDGWLAIRLFAALNIAIVLCACLARLVAFILGIPV